MSGYLDSAVAHLGRPRADVLIDHDGYFLVGLSIQVLVDEEQQVRRDPIEPPLHPCDPSHVSVEGGKGSSRRRRLARKALWVTGSCPVTADPTIPAVGPYDPG